MKSKKDRLVEYIDKVIDQSCDASNFMGDRPKYWFMIIGDDLVFHMEEFTKRYAGDYVVKRALYRLHKNLEKNFGLKLFVPKLWHYNVGVYRDLYELADPRIGFDWRRALAEVNVLGQKFILCSKFDVVSPDDMTHELDDQLCQHIDFSHLNFKDVFKAYSEVFNESPVGIWAYYRKHGTIDGLNSKEFVESTSKQDFQEHQCFYYSVCMYASKKCNSADGCPRPYDKVMRDAIARSKWLNLKKELLGAQMVEYLLQ